MSTTLHSFMDIFGTTVDDNGEEIVLDKIVIPIIQRDYAQGRRDPDIDRVRSRFLDALYRAVTESPVTLDFVYGDIDENGVMTPLDGQQRLTTLFLLHWYAARRSGIPDGECEFLRGFGYETRYSARYFCEELVGFTPTFTFVLSEEIVDQAWFPLDWLKDPTIASMLVMLDAIDEKFRDVDDLWERLKGGAITFYFLPIRDMGLTDELYIKMNSRGKPLTRFEHFKAELERCIHAADAEVSERVMRKVDRDWTDLLWQYRDSGTGGANDLITDDEFLHYFQFVCDVLCYREGKSPQGRSSDEFDLLDTYFAGDRERVLGNVTTLESYFDCWCHIDGHKSPTAFLESCMAHEPEAGKIVLDGPAKVDIFEDCLHSYSDRSGRRRQFPLNRMVLLYAVTCHLLHQGEIVWDDYVRRLRVVNNLIQNSEDAISDRIERNRMPAILAQVDAIMLTGSFDDSLDPSFNANQIEEEKVKQAFLEEHPEKAPLVFALEDHPLLKGQIAIVGIDNVDYADRFASLFACDWDLVDRAMMSIDDYGQRDRYGWKYQYGSRWQVAWDQLFHRSASSGFEKTSKVLVELLSRAETFSNDTLSHISNEFLASCEESSRYPWRYYYVKYDVFRPGRYGMHGISDKAAKPYVSTVMWTASKYSENAYVPYLKAADPEHISRDKYGQRLSYGDRHIICKNDAYELRLDENDEVLESYPISQDEDGVDTEDRVLVLKEFLELIEPD